MQPLLSVGIGLISGFLVAFINHKVIAKTIAKNGNLGNVYPVRTVLYLVLFTGLFFLSKKVEGISLNAVLLSAVGALTVGLFLFTKMEQKAILENKDRKNTEANVQKGEE